MFAELPFLYNGSRTSTVREMVIKIWFLFFSPVILNWPGFLHVSFCYCWAQLFICCDATRRDAPLILEQWPILLLIIIIKYGSIGAMEKIRLLFSSSSHPITTIGKIVQSKVKWQELHWGYSRLRSSLPWFWILIFYPKRSASLYSSSSIYTLNNKETGDFQKNQVSFNSFFLSITISTLYRDYWRIGD